MSITQITTEFAGQVGVRPALVRILCTDSYDTVIAPGYLNGAVRQGYSMSKNDYVFMSYNSGANTAIFTVSISNGIFTLVPAVIMTVSPEGQTSTVTLSSATPPTTRALTGAISDTATSQTSGNLVGVRGQVTVPTGKTAGASVFLYGAQGKCIISGTMNASSGWITGVQGQLDISTATLTAGNLSCLWGDAGATGPSVTASNFDLLRLTNSTSTTSNSHLFTFGKATMWAYIDDNNHGSGFFATAGTSSGSAGDTSHCNAPKVLKCMINGAAAYIPCFTQNT